MKEYRGGLTYKRTKKERDLDFEISCDLLAQGKTWAEIAEHINSIRDYFIRSRTLSTTYKIRLENAALERKATDELDRMIDDLEAIMIKAMKQFQDSLKDKVQLTEEGVFNKAGQFIPTKKVEKTIRSSGASQFLDIYMKAWSKKAELLGLGNQKDFDINIFLKDAAIVDGEGTNMEPIKSEREARDYGKNL